MRIAVVDYYHPTVDFKDPGQITLGLREAGADPFLIPLAPTDSDRRAPFTIVTADVDSDAFWARTEVDAVLVFSRLDPRHTPLLRRLKAHGKRLILKGDTDGTLGYPLVPNYLRAVQFPRDPIGWAVRNVKWRLPIKTFVGRKIEQIRLADAVIIESPAALGNVARVLAHWGEAELVDKLTCVPNPVAPDVCEAVLGPKENVIVASGRWEDEGAKNTRVLVRVLGDFLRTRPEYRTIVIGSGAEDVDRLTHAFSEDVRARMDVRGVVARGDVMKILSRARICVVPSRLESFGLAAAEAVCMGCSLVVTPIESLIYLSAHGSSGTVARGFTRGPLLAALADDVAKWDRGEYDPTRLAEYWRPKLGRKEVAYAILAIVEEIRRRPDPVRAQEFPRIS